MSVSTCFVCDSSLSFSSGAGIDTNLVEAPVSAAAQEMRCIGLAVVKTQDPGAPKPARLTHILPTPS